MQTNPSAVWICYCPQRNDRLATWEVGICDMLELALSQKGQEARKKTSALSPSGLEHIETNAEAKWIQPDTTHTEDCLVKQNLCLQDLTLAEG